MATEGELAGALRDAIAERLELEAELKALNLEVSEHDADRIAELVSHKKAVENLRSQVTEARGQLVAAGEVVTRLESILMQERRAHCLSMQALANHAAARNRLSDPAMVASQVGQEEAAEVAALQAKLNAASAIANRRRELLAESEAESAELAEFLRHACEARPEFAKVGHDAAMRSAKGYISKKLAELNETKHELGMLYTQIERSSERQSVGVPHSALADLSIAHSSLQAEARSKANDIDLLRTQAAESLRRAVEAETRVGEFEERLRCGLELASMSPQHINRTAESPAANTRSPEIGNIAANVNVSAVSRRLSFSPFDISRDFMPDVESPVVDIAGSLEINPSDVVVGDALYHIKPAQSVAAVGASVETPPQNSSEAQRRRLLALVANAKKQFTSGP